MKREKKTIPKINKPFLWPAFAMLFMVMACSDHEDPATEQTDNPPGALPQLQWEKTFDGPYSEHVKVILEKPGGGYLAAGEVMSTFPNGNAANFHGSIDIYLMDLDPQGNILWERCYGGSGTETLGDIQKTEDGGYIMIVNLDLPAGVSSTDGDIAVECQNNFPSIGWVVKIAPSGDIQWQKCLHSYAIYSSILQSPDGGYLTVSSRNYNALLTKLNQNGGIVWEREYGGADTDVLTTVINTSDGGYLAGGNSKSTDGAFSENHGSDIWVFKTNASGAIQWQKLYGSTSGVQNLNDIKETPQGNFVFTGSTNSPLGTTGDVTEYFSGTDIWAVQIDPTGTLLWQKSLGGANHEWGHALEVTQNGDILLAGTTNSWNNHITEQFGSTDIWVISLSSEGQLMWQKSLGGAYPDEGYSIVQSAQGGIIVAGMKGESLQDVDMYIAKLQ